MVGNDSERPTQVRVGCTDLAGHPHDLIVIEDPAGRVVVSPPGEWAVLAPLQVTRLRAALAASADDESGTRNTA